MQKITGYKVAGLLLCFLGLLLACKKEKPAANAAMLHVADFYPNSGKAGTLVTITGTGFDTQGEISFAGTKGEVVSAMDTILVVRAPENGQTGTITFKTETKSVEVGNYTYQQLSVQGVNPANGPAGSHIRISGAGFSSLNAPAEVLINDKAATVSSATDTLLVVEVPVDAGSGPVTVKVDGSVSVGAPFRYQAISGIKPLTGGKGTKVTIKGVGFDPSAAANSVDFNGKPAVITAASAEQLVVVAPDQLTTGPLSVTINGQKITGPAFTVVPFPFMQTVSPLSGPAGQKMIIDGTNFSAVADENVVTINGVNVPVNAATSTELTLTLPAGVGAGKVQLAVNDQVFQGPVFTEQSMGITKLLPDNGLAGTQVKISGIGFSKVAAENEVTFNGTPAVIISASDTLLEVTTPLGVSTGPVKVRRAALTAQSPSSFNRAGIITVAGGTSGTELSNSINSIVVDAQGNLFVGDNRKFNILKITPAGAVSVFAGSPEGQPGYQDGHGTAALFNSIGGLVMDVNNNIYASDPSSRAVRKITPQGEVTSIAHDMAMPVSRLAIDQQGALYGTQTFYGMLKIYQDGSSEKLFSYSNNDACRHVVDPQGNVYFGSDMYQPYISQYNAVTKVTMVRWLGSDVGYRDGAFTSALFYYGYTALVRDAAGNILVMDANSYALRKIDFSTSTVSTLFKGAAGYVDGSFQEAKISSVSDMAVDKEGNIYLVDPGNRAIRKVILK